MQLGSGSMPSMGRMGGMGTGPDTKKGNKAHYLTRTDFLIQFAWTPPEPGAPAPDQATLDKLGQELADSLKKQGAIQANSDAAVKQGSKALLDKREKEESGGAKAPATTTPPASTTPGQSGTPPASAPPATPPANGAAAKK
jgi:hypothetical protein